MKLRPLGLKKQVRTSGPVGDRCETSHWVEASMETRDCYLSVRERSCFNHFMRRDETSAGIGSPWTLIPEQCPLIQCGKQQPLFKLVQDSNV